MNACRHFHLPVILGAGGMGTALAYLLARRAEHTRLVARDPARAAALQGSRENANHLAGFTIPASVEVTADFASAFAGTDLVVVAIPTAFLRSGLERVAASFPADVPVLSVVKGIERETFARPSEVIREVLGPRPIAILSGPSHAEEIVRGLPTSVVVAGEDEALNVALRDTLSGDAFRVYTNPDAVGVELAGALKNILGIAAGICDGLRFGDNAKAALLTRGLVEVARFATARGAHPETFWGLAGVGDVLTTCYSPFGRNRAVGLRIGAGESLSEILASMNDVAEGVTTTQSVHAEALRRGIEMPITAEVYRILFEGKSPRTAGHGPDVARSEGGVDVKPALPPLPGTCGVAFKEWAGVCQALRDGRQTLILRKGGVSEGPDGFTPEYPAFWLYPTSVHQQEQGLRDGYGRVADVSHDPVSLDLIAVVASIQHVDRVELLDGLESQHVWTDETVRNRFHYRTPGLWVLGVRVFRRKTPWRIPETPAHLGCKSWVPLDEDLVTEPAFPVLDAGEFAQRVGALSQILQNSLT